MPAEMLKPRRRRIINVAQKLFCAIFVQNLFLFGSSTSFARFISSFVGFQMMNFPCTRTSSKYCNSNKKSCPSSIIIFKLVFNYSNPCKKLNEVVIRLQSKVITSGLPIQQCGCCSAIVACSDCPKRTRLLF